MSLEEKCYQLLKKIPAGRITTYKLLAEQLDTRAYRHVGTLLSKNPDLIKVPCHRVVRSDGGIGGYALGVAKKIALLEAEGIEINADTARVVCLDRFLYRFEDTLAGQ